MQQPWTYTLYMYYLIHYNSPENREKRREYRKRRMPEDNMQLLMVLLLVTLLMTSCVTKKACDRKFPFVEHDSTSIVTNTVTIYRDTTVYITLPGDTVYESIPIGEGVSELKTPMARSFAWVKDGRLWHRMDERDTVIASTIKNALKASSSSVSKKTVEHQTVNILTGCQMLQVWVGRVLGLILILDVIIFKLKKK